MGSYPASFRGPAAALAVLLLSAGCGDLPAPLACSEAAACPSGSWCRSGQCAANSPPVAVIDVPASPGTNRPVIVGGGGSHDDDPGDAIASWAWRLTPPPGTTGCEPLATSAPERDVTVVFPCPGEHAISLTVTDSLGAASAASTVRFQVAPTVDPPAVEVGADLALDHICGGEPITCTPWDGSFADVGLSTTAVAPADATFAYRWSVELPPELAGQTAPRITFTPGDAAPAPRVRIETSGSAIAGRYTFVVTATDTRGMVAVGRQRVDVRNRPPVLAGGGRLELPHSFEPVLRQFLATGETPPATWTDPDGDPVTSLGFTGSHSGDGDAILDVQGLGDRARLTVVVPFAQESDAGYLIGPGVSRRVELRVADVNGARASTGWDVVVTNRPPRLSAAVAAASVDHTYESSFQRYAAQAELSAWVDDDGDPIHLTLSGDAACAEVAERHGVAWVTCATPFTGRPDPGPLVGSHLLALDAADPFDPGPSQSTHLEVRNRPPHLATRDLLIRVACSIDRFRCCTPGLQKGTCEEYDFRFEATSAQAALVVDDDGDPLEFSAVPSGGCLSAADVPHPCTGSACGPVLSLCSIPWSCGAMSPAGDLAVSATDGLAVATGSVAVAGDCPP